MRESYTAGNGGQAMLDPRLSENVFVILWFFSHRSNRNLLRSVELGGAKAEVKRFLIPFSLRLETAQGCLSFQAFRGAKAFLAAVETACQAEPAVPT